MDIKFQGQFIVFIKLFENKYSTLNTICQIWTQKEKLLVIKNVIFHKIIHNLNYFVTKIPEQNSSLMKKKKNIEAPSLTVSIT